MRIADHDITLDNIGSWPRSVRWSVYLVLLLAIMGAVYFFDTKAQLEMLTSGQKKELQLKFDLDSKYYTAANLLAYKKQLLTITDIFQSLLEELPGSNQLSELIDDISGASKTAGLQIMSLVPQKDQAQSFYVLFPIQISVVGRYHQLGDFVSKLAGLNRIIIPGDYTITALAPAAGKDKKVDLSQENLAMVMQINTYRYIPNPNAVSLPATSARVPPGAAAAKTKQQAK